MSKLTVARIEAAIAACVVMGFCIFSFVAATYLVYTGTKVFITYACTTLSTSDPNQSSAIVGQTCEYIGDLSESASFMGYTMLRDLDPFGSIISLITCWMILVLVISLTVPQLTAAWDLFRATTLTKKSNDKATEIGLIRTWRHQDLQNTIIFVELLVAMVLSLAIFVSPQDSQWAQLEWIVCILVKVLTGRVFCAFFVEIYFHEQLLTIYSSEQILDLPAPIKTKLEKEYKQEEKKCEDDEKPKKALKV